MALQSTGDENLPARTVLSTKERMERHLSDVVRPRKASWGPACWFGYGVLFLFFGLFGVWAATAPLASGVIATGQLRADSERKTIQHYGGGVVDEVLVSDGDRVKKGQVLLRLNPTRADSQIRMLKNRYIAGRAERARQIAARDSLDNIPFPADLLAQQKTDPLVTSVIETMEKLYASRKKALAQQIEIRREQIAQNHTEITALQERETSVQSQLSLIEEELAGVQQMFDKGYARKDRLLALKRNQAALYGQIGQIKASRARALQRINEQELKIQALQHQVRAQAIDRLRTLNTDLTNIEEQMTIASDNKDRIEIKAPTSGKVIGSIVHTVGAVIGNGMALMDIVPEEDALVVEAKVKAKDIDSVRIGATVQVRISAFNPRITPPADGVVESISADAITAGKGKPKYEVIIRLDPDSIRTNFGDQQLTSGMPASSIIAVGERTLLTYWMTPLIASFELALREP